nr:inositol monophosphatase family protein [Rhizobiaceae bacterium]
GAIANRTPIAVSGRELPACIVASRSHLNARTRDYLDRHAGTACRHVGSSLKFCLVARGEADLYPSFRATMQWDTAAGDAILRAAGGETRDAEGDLLSYLPDLCVDGVHFCNPSFVATGYRRR